MSLKENILSRLSSLEENLGYSFKNKELLLQALCHPSFWNEHPTLVKEHQERLEFLGDAVLELLVSEYLFQNFPELSEGELTQKRALLVRTESLGELAQKIGLDRFVLLGKGERANHQDNHKALSHVLANTFEALFGALWLEGGYQLCHRLLLPLIEELMSREREEKDPKSQLQELTQAHFKERPEYVLLKEEGPDHKKEFQVAVYLKGVKLGTGKGSSKQEAERRAAKEALKNKENWLRLC